MKSSASALPTPRTGVAELVGQALREAHLELRLLLCTGPGLAPEVKDARRQQALALLDVMHNLPVCLEGQSGGEQPDLSEEVEEAHRYAERFGNGAHEANLTAVQLRLRQQEPSQR